MWYLSVQFFQLSWYVLFYLKSKENKIHKIIHLYLFVFLHLKKLLMSSDWLLNARKNIS